MTIINAIIMGISTLAVGLATALGLVVFAAMPPVMAGVSAIMIMLALVQIQLLMTRARRRLGLHGKMRALLKANSRLSEEVLDLREQVESQINSLSRLEQQDAMIIEEHVTPLRTSTERLGDEVRAINAVNSELTEGFIANGKKLDGFAKLLKRLEKKQKNLAQDLAGISRTAPAQTVKGDAPASAAPEASEASGPAAREQAPAAAGNPPARRRDKTPQAAPMEPARLELIRNAMAQNRMDLFLQPIVTLPQRKVRYYEAFTRLHTAQGETIMPDEYLPVAEKSGQMANVDNLLLFRAVKVLRRLADRNRKVGIFCNISPASLTDVAFFPQLMEFLEQNRKLAGILNFEFPQSMISGFGPMEFESLAALGELGFRFSLDQVTSLNADFQKLNELGFRYIKLDADILLNRMNEADTWVHTADLADLMQRHGLHLIAEKVETENTVLDLLDFNVDLAQGYLFGKPAQVRDDILSRKPVKATLKMAS
ncbi:MAG TPA: EAL domain-containing protein [Rhizobiales bacterium]|nr:EAL domain-containing protein [Hyphomicrobiales bacterium]